MCGWTIDDWLTAYRDGATPCSLLPSNTDVVPACRALDRVSVFATTARDATRVCDVAAALDLRDGLSHVATHEQLDFREGRQTIRIEEEPFDLGEYNAFLERISGEMATFKAAQKQAFDAEVERWAAEALAGEGAHEGREAAAPIEIQGAVVAADITGSVGKLLAQQGEKVGAGDPLLILEAMKMEFQIAAPHDGVVGSFHCRPDMMISAGDPLVSLV